MFPLSQSHQVEQTATYKKRRKRVLENLIKTTHETKPLTKTHDTNKSRFATAQKGTWSNPQA